MLRRLKGHKDVILEAGGENYYPAKGAAMVWTLQSRDMCIRRQAQYTFLGTSFSGMKKRSPQGWVYGVPQESCTARLAAGCSAPDFVALRAQLYRLR